MKNTFLAVILLFLSVNLSAQTDSEPKKSPFNPYVGLIFESTVSGGLGGFYGGTFIGKRFGTGIYYEIPTSEFDSQFNENRSYLGIYGTYTLLSESKIDLGLLLRIGFENEQFVVIAPSLVTSYAVSQRFHISLLAGYRYEKPALGLTIGYRFKKS